MNAIEPLHRVEPLQRRRDQLRNRLALAWEMRLPTEAIHQIEDDLRTVWEQLETARARERGDVNEPHRRSHVCPSR